MRKIERRTFIKNAAAAAIGGGVFGAPFALAQEAGWPTKPIKFIVPLAPGGAIDFIARAVGEVMQRSIGQQIIVENRTGAGGTIGMDAAMKSPPDGYTVLITNDNAASAPHIMKLSYDYTKELLPVVLSRPSVADSRRAFLARRQHGRGTGRLREGKSRHRARDVGRRLEPACDGEWFASEAGIKIDHVPYRGAGQAINDLIAAHVKTRVPRPDRADAA